MPSKGDGDACYTPIEGIPYCRTKHTLLSWKASEQLVEGIAINVPSILLCRDCKLNHEQLRAQRKGRTEMSAQLENIN